MGSSGLPKIFVNAKSETPDAKKWNDNFDFLNFTQRTFVRGGDFEKFLIGVPDSWTLNGAGAISASEPDPKHGATAVKLTFGTADAFLSQDSAELGFLKGRKVKAWVWVKTTATNAARLKITDGVGSSASAFHSGSGSYELLEIVHDVALSATRVTLELHMEVAGFAIFDAAMLVYFDGALGFIQSPLDLVSFTKEFFLHSPAGHGTNVGDYETLLIASQGDDRMVFNVPHDFISLIAAVLVAIPAATSGPQTVELTSNHAAPGEDATAVLESDLTNTFTYIANQMQEFDISSVLTGIAAGDYVGIHIDRIGAGFGNLQVLGMRFRYNG